MLRRNVLLFHNAALGDFVMTWPIAVAVGRVLAQSRVMYVTAASKGRLAERLIGVEAVDAEAGWHGLHADDPTLPETPAKLLKSLQMAIVFSKAPDERFLSNLRTLAGDAPVVHLSPNPPAGVHVWEHQLVQLQSSPILHNAVQQVQRLVDSNGLGRTGTPSARQLVIHPGSGAERKNWQVERFIGVARIMHERGWKTTFTLGEVERERMSTAQIATMKEAGEVRSCDTLDALADAIAGAAAYLGNDSGPTHLAAILGKPTLAMFGPTSDPVAWAPRGPGVRIEPFEAPVEAIADQIINLAGGRR